MSEESKKTVYYKAFEKGMVCRGKQYQENTEYEEAGADKCCKAGMMHFCENPLDTLNYYPLINDNGELSEFATVEPLAEVKKDKDKCASRKIRVGAKLTLKGFIEAAVNVLIEKTNCDNPKNAASGYYSQLAASGDSSKLAASGDSSKLAASGDYSQLAASGDYSQLAASGYYSQLAASGDSSQLAMSGKNSVGANIGIRGRAKGALGCWIVLAEWEHRGDEGWVPLCVKAGKIDGEMLKPDTWYTLANGEFSEVH